VETSWPTGLNPFVPSRKLAGVRTVLPDCAGPGGGRGTAGGLGIAGVAARGRVKMLKPSSPKSLRSAQGMKYEMNLLLASLRRVELRVEPQTITEFLKWKNRLAAYNGGFCRRGLSPAMKRRIST